MDDPRESIERRLVNLAKINAELSAVRGRFDPPREIEPLENTEPLPQQEEVMRSIEDHDGCIVIGKAGTGKSTLIRRLKSLLENCVVIAPTGLAAINAGGATIHSFFGLPLRTLNPEDVFSPKEQIAPVIESMKVLVIDEISMVTPDVIDCISNSLKVMKRSSLPFGGVKIVLVGDPLQLPPVVPDRDVSRFLLERFGTHYFFGAEVFKETDLIAVELEKVFRQSNAEFVELLDRIRLNSDHRESVARFNRDCFRDAPPRKRSDVHLVTTNAAAKAINSSKLSKLPGKRSVFEAIVEGRFDIHRDRFQAPHVLELKIGAQVLFVKNNKPLWVNGTIGKIRGIESNCIRVEISGTRQIVSVDRAAWEKIDYEYDPVTRRIESKTVGSFKQYPITLGWAVTIHKSQGMTLDSVRIDLGTGAFCAGQTYVALSRCRSLGAITLARAISMRDVRTDPQAIVFCEKISAAARR